MMNSTFIDYDKKNVETEVISDGILIKINEANGTAGQLIQFTNDEYNRIVEGICIQAGEPTPKEQENKILSLKNKVEELKDLVEQYKETLEEMGR